MTDAEFWEHVFGQGSASAADGDDDYDRTDWSSEYHYDQKPCPLCGSYQECGFDQDGRPYIHVAGLEEDG